jgi:DNA-binding response OmpR family regulator
LSKHILVIDDEPGIREILRFFLETQGWEVETASNGEEGLKAFSAAPPPVVLLDGSMPGMNGYETARAIRDTGIGDPRIIMLTGDGAPQPSAATLETLGIDHYLTKPLDDQELFELLETLFPDA